MSVGSTTPLGPVDPASANTTKARTDGLGRDAFLQRRLYLIHDGNPPETPIDPELQEAIDEADADEADTEAPPPAP
mgnify:CR=1 FL=1